MSGEPISLDGPEASLAFGGKLAAVAAPGDLIALIGPLGAGKTSIARGLLAALGLEEEAPSPSFAIVQPYAPPEVAFPVLHVDLYRIEEPSELAQFALDEAREDSLLVVEWPELGGVDRWPEALILSLAVTGDGCRRLTAQVPASWKDRWPPT
jgi:tRNA threonylcarbamoyladenosine biosynthesis protein TsaE